MGGEAADKLVRWGTTFVASPPSHSRASLGCERSLSTSLGGLEAKKSRKMDNTLEGILLCAAKLADQFLHLIRAGALQIIWL